MCHAALANTLVVLLFLERMHLVYMPCTMSTGM